MWTRTLILLAAITVGPAIVIADPTTQPSPPTAAQSSNELTVLVLPFSPLISEHEDWIGRAVQQSMAADLSRPTNGHVIQAMTTNNAATNTAEAIEAGQKANANFVVFGNYQLLDPNLKMTGQVIEVSTGRVVGGLKSTGSIRELFDMQDTLTSQAKWALGVTQQAAATASHDAAPVAINTQGPLQVNGDREARYPGSPLSQAVDDNQSLIDTYDAAGTSYRNSYYDNTYLSDYAPYYGGYYGYYGGGYYYAPYWGHYHRWYYCNPHVNHFGDGTTHGGQTNFGMGIGLGLVAAQPRLVVNPPMQHFGGGSMSMGGGGGGAGGGAHMGGGGHR